MRRPLAARDASAVKKMSWLVRGFVGEKTKDAVGGVPAATVTVCEAW